MPDIPRPLLDRLAKICGRLSSDFDGERAAAALLATGLLRQHGLTWAELIAAAAVPGQTHLERRVHGEGWRRTIGRCLDREEALTPWEIEFLRGVEQQRRDSPTPKQQSILDRIADRVLGGGDRH